MKSVFILGFFTLFTAAIIITAKFRDSGQRDVIGQQVLATGYVNTNDAISLLIDQLKNDPKNDKIKKRLGFTLIQKARQSGNAGLYDPQALQLFEEILKENKNDFEALIGKSTVLLSQHHFAEALVSGQEALIQNPYSSSVYGVLTDAYVETGNYNKAIESADQMASLHPDLRSYSRISYLREIHGDMNGAIEAMDMAVKAGIPGMEETEWARYQLGYLYERSGKLMEADLQYQSCVFFKADFAAAYIGKGRIFQKQKNYLEAERFFKLAQNLSTDYSIDEHLSRLYREKNEQTKAAIAIRQSIEKLVGKDGKGSVHGHYADRELAGLYLESYDYKKALHHALLEYERRSENIDVNHTLAWTYYKLGEYSKALVHITKARVTNSQDPELLFHAGLIHLKNNERLLGQKEMGEALAINPHLDLRTQLEAKF